MQPGLATKAKTLRKKVAELEKTERSVRVTPVKGVAAKGCGIKRPTVVDKRIASVEAKLKEGKEPLEISLSNAVLADDRASDDVNDLVRATTRANKVEALTKEMNDKPIDTGKRADQAEGCAFQGMDRLTEESNCRVHLEKDIVIVSAKLAQAAEDVKSTGIARKSSGDREKVLQSRLALLSDKLDLPKRQDRQDRSSPDIGNVAR